MAEANGDITASLVSTGGAMAKVSLAMVLGRAAYMKTQGPHRWNYR